MTLTLALCSNRNNMLEGKIYEASFYQKRITKLTKDKVTSAQSQRYIEQMYACVMTSL